MKQTQQYNRWAILIASAAVVFCTGSIYTFSVLRDPLAASGIPLDAVLTAYAINAGLAPIPMIIGGFIVDKKGSRWLALVGLGLYGVGWFWAGFANSAMTLYLSYGLIAGIGQALAYAACLNNTLRFFPDKRALAAGLVTAANGGATIVMAPVARTLIVSFDVHTMMKILGVAFLIVAGITFLVIRVAPDDYKPKGWVEPTQAATARVRNLRWPQMLGTVQFWTIVVMFLAGAFSGLMIAANAAPIAKSMWMTSAEVAVFYVSIFAFANMLGRIVYGALADRIGNVHAVQVIFVVIVASLFILILGKGTAFMLGLGLVGLGLCFGGILGTMPALVMGSFGPINQGVNYGLAFAGYALAAMFAPKIAGRIGESHSGDYSLAFYIAIAAAVIGLLATLIYTMAERKRLSSAASAPVS